MLSRQLIKSIENAITRATGLKFVLSRQSRQSGGDINEAFVISDESRKFFVKINTAEKVAQFTAEKDALQHIASTHTINVPRVICLGIDESISYLVLEYLPLNHSGDIAQLATALAALHQIFNSEFGYSVNNFIGSTPQINHWNKNWSEFFTENRIGYQLDLLASRNISRKIIQKGMVLKSQIAHLLADHHSKPSLIHGDLWRDNYGFLIDGTPVIYDPACYFADHEAELAMMELFGHLDKRFFDTYHAEFAIAPGYAQRKPLYNLYHLLNHANLFGGHYVQQAESVIDQLLE